LGKEKAYRCVIRLTIADNEREKKKPPQGTQQTYKRPPGRKPKAKKSGAKGKDQEGNGKEKAQPKKKETKRTQKQQRAVSGRKSAGP